MKPNKKEVDISGPPDDETVVDSVIGDGKEELVVVVAGGMTSQLTYDGVDVCASRVAWEVRGEHGIRFRIDVNRWTSRSLDSRRMGRGRSSSVL